MLRDQYVTSQLFSMISRVNLVMYGEHKEINGDNVVVKAEVVITVNPTALNAGVTEHVTRLG